MKRKEQYADEIIEMLERTKSGAWASNINLNTKDRVIEVCQNCVDSWSDRKFKDHCTTSPQALEQTEWIPVSERVPEEEGNYLVTRDGNLGHSIVDIATWFKSEKANNGFHKANRVSAWCKLPDPYRGGEGE